MTVEHAIPIPDRAGLRQFGLIFGGLIAGIFGGLLPWLFNAGISPWPWAIGAIFALWALLAPGTLMPVYLVWMRFAGVIGRVNTALILFIIFVLFFIPAGLILQLVNRLRRGRQRELPDSWRISREPITPESMEDPF